ncbi:hypothetical protein KJZ99_04525 [bacterium]|nr:hypothetical protein [bacterium]
MRHLLAILVVAANALAIPQLINYQGQLNGTGGIPLDTTVSMTMRLYDGPGGAATLLWTEAHPAVAVQGGLFDLTLGSITALNLSLMNNTEVWLGVTIGNDSEMTPRERIVAVGYSFRVGTVDGASGGSVTSDLIVTGRGTFGSGNTNSGTNGFVAGGSNSASQQYTVISGGSENAISSQWSTISGGRLNSVTGNWGAIGGGLSNSVSAPYGTIAGGQDNLAGANNAAVGGGRNNYARGLQSVVAGGGGLAADSNSAQGAASTISGGLRNLAIGTQATVAADGTTRHAETIPRYLVAADRSQLTLIVPKGLQAQ